MSMTLSGLEVAFVDKDLENSTLKASIADVDNKNGDLVRQVLILCP